MQTNSKFLIEKILEQYPCEGECQFSIGMATSTMAYYAPIYDKHGVNINPDRNTTTTDFYCRTCQKQFMIKQQLDNFSISEKSA